MKTRIILSVFFSIFLINGIFGQVVNSYPIPNATSENFSQCILLNQELWLADGYGSYATFFYSNSSWTENYNCDVHRISGVKNQNGENVVYAYGSDDNNVSGLFKWNNVYKRWNIIPNIPYFLKFLAEIKVVDETCIYLLSSAGAFPKLWKYTGTSFVELYSDTASSSYENFLYADNNRVIFSRYPTSVLLCYEVEQDTVVELVSIPDTLGIQDIKSADGINFFILSRDGNLYRYNINDQVLVDLTISPLVGYRNTMEVASNNRLIFLGGGNGIKKVWINNNGDPEIQTIYNITHPELKISSSSIYGNTVIFAGKLGNGEYCYYLRLDYTTGVIETSLPDINIYPNPSKDWMKIDGISEVSVVKIFDITGKLVLSQEYQVDDRIDISCLTPGMYILNIKNSEGEFNQKIIKQ
jgi:hypothetical protein